MSDAPHLAAEEHLAAHRAALDRIFVARDPARLGLWFDATHTLHTGMAPMGVCVGRPALEAWIGRVLHAFGEGLVTVRAQHAGGALAVTRFELLVRHTGEVGGVPSSLRWPTLRGLWMSRAGRQRIAESWLETDALAVLAEAGGWRVPDAARLAPPEPEGAADE